MLSDWVRLILQATVYDAAIQTPLEPAKKLSERFNNDIRFKREDFQPVFSFKLRGAYNRISQLSEADKAKGVICASAGNHAQGVAFSASRLGLNNIIVMPTTTPDIKVSAVKSLGGNVVLYGDSFDESNRYAIERAQTDGLTFIPPYDDELVIAGLQKQIQSTTGQTSLSAKYYKDLKLSEKDGNTVLKYSINNDGLNQYVKDVTSQMTTVTGGSNSIKISSLTGTKTLNDKDLPVKESIQMVMESGDNETGSITLKMNLTYHDPGKSVTVTLPDDLNTYQEISN